MWQLMWPNDAHFLRTDSQLQYFGDNDSDWTVTEIEEDDDTSWGFSPESEVGQVRWPVGILLTALTVLIAVGNSLVIMAVLLERQLRTFENFFFASLAIADLSIALFVLPLSLSVELSDGRWHFGRSACDFFIFVDVSCCTASILHLCTIGLNRFWSISSPLKYAAKQTNRRAFVMIVSVWLLSFVIASPPIFGWPKRTHSVTDQCTYDQDRLYVVCSAMGSFYIPLLVMIVVYYKIYRLSKVGAKFRRSLNCEDEGQAGVYLGSRQTSDGRDTLCNRRVSGGSRGSAVSARHQDGSSSRNNLVRNTLARGNHPRNADRKGQKLWSLVCRAASKRRRRKSGARPAEVKTAKTLGLIMTVFVVCWLPFFLLYVIRPFCPHCYIPVALDRSALWLGYANSLLNPIIYICCKPLFRRTFKKILLLDFCRLASRYTCHVECCPPARHRLHHVPRRRLRHVIEGESSFSYRADYGHLSVSVPPAVIPRIEDGLCCMRPGTLQGTSNRQTSARDGPGCVCTGSSSSPPSIDWSSLDSAVKRVPNVCVTDILEVPVSGGGDYRPPKPTRGLELQAQTTLDELPSNNTSSTPGTGWNTDRGSRAQHRPRPRTDLILNSDFSPRVRVLDRRCTWSEPRNWRRESLTSEPPEEADNTGLVAFLESLNCELQTPLPTSDVFMTAPESAGTERFLLRDCGDRRGELAGVGSDPDGTNSMPTYTGHHLQNETKL